MSSVLLTRGLPVRESASGRLCTEALPLGSESLPAVAKPAGGFAASAGVVQRAAVSRAGGRASQGKCWRVVSARLAFGVRAKRGQNGETRHFCHGQDK